jgi:hypothetical protein
VEDAGSDETSKRCREDVSGVENGDASGDLFSVVEEREDVDGTGVVCNKVLDHIKELYGGVEPFRSLTGSLSQTEEETSEKKADKVLGKSSEGADDGPESHAETLSRVSLWKAEVEEIYTLTMYRDGRVLVRNMLEGICPRM